MKGISTLNFEEIADEYSKKLNKKNSRISKISRCDYLTIKEDEILFIEKTSYNNKNLFDPKKYSKEIIENIKKMWGSLLIFGLYTEENDLIDKISGRDRIYILLLDNRKFSSARIIGNIMKSLRKYRNGGYSDIKYEFLNK